MEFREIARFPSRLEAETVGHALDQHDIPFLVKSDAVGMFGPGMVGSSPVGATLWVPEDAIDQVKELLSCVVSLDEDSDPPANDNDDEGESPGPGNPADEG